MTDLAGRPPQAVQLRPDQDPDAGRVLPALARAAIIARCAPPPGSTDAPAWLDAPGATFVTLTVDGALRGCIGSIEAHRSLREDVVRNACAAAFSDPRFPPLAASELPDVRIEVSLLSPTEALPSRTREELIAQLRPGTDGLVLAWCGHRGTFLPQVWEQLPDPVDFVEHLLHKAGLPVSFWAPEVSARRFTVTSWTEAPP